MVPLWIRSSSMSGVHPSTSAIGALAGLPANPGDRSNVGISPGRLLRLRLSVRRRRLSSSQLESARTGGG
eukprot:5769103-Pleurochrysis_carterae.AAC.1